MKNETVLIGLLTISALVLSVMLMAYKASQPARADMQVPSPDYTLLTSTAGFGKRSRLNLIDNRDSLVLIYTLNGRQLRLTNVLNLNNQFNPPQRP